MIRPNLGQRHFAQSSLASESCFLSAHFGFRRQRARQMMPQTAPGRNDEYHALPGGRDKGTRSPDRPHGVAKASESQLTESNLTSANGQELRLWPMPAIPQGIEIVATDPEIWRKPALRKIAAATRANTAAVAHILRQRRHRARPGAAGYPASHIPANLELFEAGSSGQVKDSQAR